jgi:hypothetical protein
MTKAEALQEVLNEIQPLARSLECRGLRDKLRARELNGLACEADAMGLRWILLHDKIAGEIRMEQLCPAGIAG